MLKLHGVQNVVVPSSAREVCSLSWKRGGKKSNAGSTEEADIIFGMATFKHDLDLEMTFVQNKKTKEVQPKEMLFTLKVCWGFPRCSFFTICRLDLEGRLSALLRRFSI